MNQVQSEDQAVYKAYAAQEELILEHALKILDSRLKERACFESPKAVKDYLRLQHQGLDYEIFGVMWLTSQHKLISYEKLFRGTLTQTSVYPREVIVQALARKAAAAVLCHNHPSGNPKPSNADKVLTLTLKSALSLVDVRVLDHIVVTDAEAVSMAECGLM